ncbi:MAG: transcription termination factor NusA [Bryobacteraceae bacterium]|nr:transcription termination factor NusA [Bryobacteraceae bacterium]MDW8378763.1 transcription termination factor NusA [Bryobacterales bacterium]
MDTIFQSIELLSKEKGIDPQIILDAVKDAMLVAARKHFRTNEDLVAEFDDRQKGVVQIYAVYKVVEAVTDPARQMTLEQARKVDASAEIGSEIRILKSTESLGRISAQTAKQVILQKVREAERETVYAEYANRIGELVNCVVKRIEGQDLICDLGKTEARLPKKEQSRLENFTVGDRVRCVIRAVEKSGKNAGVIVSRAAPEFVERLFEQEVPEIYDGTVQIKGCAREAGERTKIAVTSRDRDVDSVGACVGMKGMRVQSIIRELRGEKIDIIEYSDDPVVFATHALSPAKIGRVTILNAAEKHMEVIVDDSQLSLAIGKRGQNVRLASKLLGWRIDIKSEEEKRQEVESAMAALTGPGAPVSVLLEHGLSESIAAKLLDAGVSTVERLGAMTPEELEQAGFSASQVENIQLAVNQYFHDYEAAAERGEEAAVPDESSLAEETAAPSRSLSGEASATEQIESDTIKNAD